MIKISIEIGGESVTTCLTNEDVGPRRIRERKAWLFDTEKKEEPDPEDEISISCGLHDLLELFLIRFYPDSEEPDNDEYVEYVENLDAVYEKIMLFIAKAAGRDDLCGSDCGIGISY
jgi:hypothetical protein